MATYNNWNDLIKGLQKEVNNSLKKNVAPLVEKALQQNAEDIAAGAYSREYGGISDPDNIVSEIENDNTLLVMDIAEFDTPYWGEYQSSLDPYGTAFAESIDSGTWVDAKAFIDSGYQRPAPKRDARKFVTKTQEDINNNPDKVINALKKGLG